jgi:hypothetical protein
LELAPNSTQKFGVEFFRTVVATVLDVTSVTPERLQLNLKLNQRFFDAVARCVCMKSDC